MRLATSFASCRLTSRRLPGDFAENSLTTSNICSALCSGGRGGPQASLWSGIVMPRISVSAMVISRYRRWNLCSLGSCIQVSTKMSWARSAGVRPSFCIPLRACGRDPDNDEPPLQIAVNDRNNSPLSLAYLRGHMDVATAILKMAQAQYAPEERPHVRYSMRTSE